MVWTAVSVPVGLLVAKVIKAGGDPSDPPDPWEPWAPPEPPVRLAPRDHRVPRAPVSRDPLEKRVLPEIRESPEVQAYKENRELRGL